MIDALKHFKAIIFIHAAFIHKIEVFLKIFVGEISDMPPILYFSHIFIFDTVFEIISLKLFFFYSGVSTTAFLASVQWWNKKVWPVIEHLDSTVNNAFLEYGITFLTITSYCVIRFSSFMYQTNCICIGFQLILDMFTYVAPSSGRHTNYHKSQEWNFGSLKPTKVFYNQQLRCKLYTIPVLCDNMCVYCVYN